jgi:hypothetical protein
MYILLKEFVKKKNVNSTISASSILAWSDLPKSLGHFGAERLAEKYLQFFGAVGPYPTGENIQSDERLSQQPSR